MKDQRAHWDAMYAETGSDRHSRPETAFGEQVLRVIPPASRILELGCGRGADAARLARHGHTVLATDFSASAIAADIAQYANVPNLRFQTLEIAAPLPFESGAFDVVYAHLSLHYLPDRATREVFRDINRVLRPGGLLAFLCKSTADPLYGRGKELEPDMFELDGHVRHFFSEAYARACLSGRFVIDELSTGDETFYKRDSAFIHVIAHKPASEL